MTGVLSVGAVALLCAPTIANAGPGQIRAGNENDNSAPLALDLTFQFNYFPPDADVVAVKDTFQQASKMLCDITDGRLEIGEVTLLAGGKVQVDQIDVYMNSTASAGAARVDLASGVWLNANYPNDHGNNGGTIYRTDGRGAMYEREQDATTTGPLHPLLPPQNQVSNTYIGRYYLFTPLTFAHELSHYALTLLDTYAVLSPLKEKHPPYNTLFNAEVGGGLPPGGGTSGSPNPDEPDIDEPDIADATPLRTTIMGEIADFGALYGPSDSPDYATVNKVVELTLGVEGGQKGIDGGESTVPVPGGLAGYECLGPEPLAEACDESSYDSDLRSPGFENGCPTGDYNDLDGVGYFATFAGFTNLSLNDPECTSTNAEDWAPISGGSRQACRGFDTSTCTWTWAGYHYNTEYLWGEIISEWEWMTRSMHAYLAANGMEPELWGELPSSLNPEPEAPEICGSPIEFNEEQLPEFNGGAVVVLLDRSGSMRYPTKPKEGVSGSNNVESCSPECPLNLCIECETTADCGDDELVCEGGECVKSNPCTEICGNAIDDNCNCEKDEDGCSPPRIEKMQDYALIQPELWADTGTQLGLVSFSTEAQELKALSTVSNSPAEGSQDEPVSAYETAIESLQPSGYTAIGDAVMRAYNTLDGLAVGGKAKGILLFTDGFETVGQIKAENEFVSQEEAYAMVKDAGVEISVISLGKQVDQFFGEMASGTGGKFIAPLTMNEAGPAFARQWAHRSGAGVVVPQLPFRVARTFQQGTSTVTQVPPFNTVRDSRVLTSTGSDAETFGDTTDDISAADLDTYEFLVEPGTTQLRLTLASSEEDSGLKLAQVEITAPAGMGPTLFDTASPAATPEMRLANRDGYTVMFIDNPNPGVWTARVRPPTPDPIGNTTSSPPPVTVERAGYLSIFVEGQVGQLTPILSNRFVTDPSTGTLFIGRVTYGDISVYGVQSTARLRRPDGSVVSLGDLSTDAEEKVDPMVFLGASQLTQPGRYEVQMTVYAETGASMLQVGDTEDAYQEPLPVEFEREIIETFWVLNPDGSYPCECPLDEDCDLDGAIGENDSVDSDGDGIADACDPDSDNDEVDDTWEDYGEDDDQDGTPNEVDPDSDDDGIPDVDDASPAGCPAVPPAVWLGAAKADQCVGSFVVPVYARAEGAVFTASVPLSLGMPQISDVQVLLGEDAEAAGVVSIDVIGVPDGDSPFRVDLDFGSSPLETGAAAEILRLVIDPTTPLASPMAPPPLPAPGVFESCVVDNTNMGAAMNTVCMSSCALCTAFTLDLVTAPACATVEIVASDTDQDGLDDICDNCPFIANIGQADVDQDGQGDACDTATGACADGVDNDGDGLADSLDPGCESPGDFSELSVANTLCDNGLDDDLDGLTDMEDPDCSSPTDTSELNGFDSFFASLSAWFANLPSSGIGPGNAPGGGPGGGTPGGDPGGGAPGGGPGGGGPPGGIPGQP